LHLSSANRKTHLTKFDLWRMQTIRSIYLTFGHLRLRRERRNETRGGPHRLAESHW